MALCVRVILQSCEIVLQTKDTFMFVTNQEKQYLCYVARRKRKLNIYVLIQGEKIKPRTMLIQ
jgi:hypothetical protein